jgi:hypothetical protein
MDIFFHDPDDQQLPPGDVRIREFTANPYPESTRVKIYLELTPFQKRPSAEVYIEALDGEVVSSASIIETVNRKMEMTLHIRGEQRSGPHQVVAQVFYDDEPDDSNGSNDDFQLPERTMVDQDRISVEL